MLGPADNRSRWLLAGAALLVLVSVSCRGSRSRVEPPGGSAPPPAPTVAAAPPAHDPHSASDPARVTVRHLGVALTIDFAERRLTGHAVLVLTRHDEAAPLRLDTAGDLEVTAVEAGTLPTPLRDRVAPVVAELGDEAHWRATPFQLEPADPKLGRALVIELPSAADVVRVHYRTAPDASGLHWLEPAQTADRIHPFLYSQSEAIQARTFIPCQDSPGVRVTYDATLTIAESRAAPASLVAVMAAGESQRVHAGRFRFVMREPIPSYLISLAVGDLARRELGPRTAVWAEPSVLDRAAAELSDTEQMVAAAEAVVGPYRWGRYDLLILPPSYPLGGMENPRLNFVSPTILAGDRSLVRLIAHELAHSWAGDLVTNATWGDTWLNEGITSYVENRIVEALYGRERAELEALLGFQSLERTLAATASEPDRQRLALDPEINDPGAGFSAISYDKGALFLRALERSYGRNVFDGFLARWFAEHAFTSVTTDQFVAFARRALPARPAVGPPVDLHEWIHHPGLPAGAPRPTSAAYQRVVAAASDYVAGALSAAELAARSFTPIELEHLLRALPRDLDRTALADLDRSFHFTAATNYEILDAWLLLAVGKDYPAATERMRSFLFEVGRYKFVVPLFLQLVASPEGQRWALEVYREARPGYHVWLRHNLDLLLDWSPP